jgi:intein/homing endonuclease
MKIRKRDSTLVDFDRSRIVGAIKKASESVEKWIDVEGLTDDVVGHLDGAEEHNIEQIQDYVEQELMNAGHYQVLRHYITYRNYKQKKRDMGVLNLKNLPDIEPPFRELGYITYKRTYARNNEEFKDTILRVLIGCQKQLNVGFTNDELRTAYEHFMNLRGSVAGRFLWQLGTTTVDKNGLLSLQNCAFCKIDAPVRPFCWVMDCLMLGVGCGVNVQRHNVEQLPPVIDRDIKIVRKDTKDADFIIPDSREGWVEFLRRVLETYFKRGSSFTFSTICVRGAGTPIIGFGGVASGPNILCEGIQDICGVLNNRRGQKLRPIDCMDITDIIGSIVVAGNVRRCLPAGTIIHTKLGMIPIENMKVGDEVLTSHGGYERVSAVYNQGRQQLVKIITKSGEFRCTHNHRMAVLTNDNRIVWKYTRSLLKNDKLITPRTPIFGQRTFLPIYKECHNFPVTPIIAWFLGFYSQQRSPPERVVLNADTYQIASKIKLSIIQFEPLWDVFFEKLDDNSFLVELEGDNIPGLFYYLNTILHEDTLPDFIWKTYLNNRKAFIAGVIDGSKQIISSTSKSWTMSLQTLCYSCGFEMDIVKNGDNYNLVPQNAFSKGMLKHMVDLVNKKKIKLTFREFWFPQNQIKNKFFHTTPIVRLEGQGPEEETWDITVESEHNFYANGYLTHNSAILVMGDADDTEYLGAKRWDLGNIPNYRAMSNNSVVCNDIRQLPDEFWEGYNGNGEPYGLINLKLAKNRGRLKDGNRYPDVVEGFNPCLTSDTFVMTTEGFKQIHKLIGKPFVALVDGLEYSSTSKGFWHTGKKPVYKIKLQQGMEVKATSNHRFLSYDGWKEVGDLSPNDDSLFLSAGGGSTWSGKGTMDDGYITGFLIGNKVYYSTHIPSVVVLLSKHIHPDEFGPIQKIQDIYFKKKKKNKNFMLMWQDLCYKQYKMSSFLFKDIAQEYDIFRDDGCIHVCEEGSYDFTIGLMKGIFDASGIIYNNVHKEMSIRLWEEDLCVLHSIQRLLLAIGIVSRTIDGTHEDCHNPNGNELLIHGDENMTIFQEKIGFLNNEKKMILSQYESKRTIKKNYCYSRIVSIEMCGEEDVYDCTIEKSHCFSANGVLSHNCAEQGLANFETCCLSEIFLPNIESYEQLQSVAITLYRICKHSLLLPCHHRETEKIVHDNMRMGIGISGVLQSTKTQLDWLDPLYEYLREYDKVYSEKLGVLTSIKLTTIKPSGTLSLLGGCTPGIHPALYRYYIRRIRIASTNPLVELCRKNNYKVEYQKNFDGTLDTKTMVVEFPCKSHDNAVLSDDMTAIDQLEKVKELQTMYSDNAISNTIYYKKEELPLIKQWLYRNYNDHVKTCSFLLRYDHGFVQAPFEAITKEKYQELIKMVVPITSGSVETDDTDASMECAGGICPVK